MRSDIHLAQATVAPVPDPTAAAAATPGAATALADVTIVVGRDYAPLPTPATARSAST